MFIQYSMRIAQNLYRFKFFCLVLASGKMWKIVSVFTGIGIPRIFSFLLSFFAQEVDELTDNLEVFLSQALYRYQTTIRI